MGVNGYLVFYAQLSDECIFTTGALTEVLYSITYIILLYINDFMIRNSNFNVFKYADDMGLAGLLQKDYINDSGVYVGI